MCVRCMQQLMTVPRRYAITTNLVSNICELACIGVRGMHAVIAVAAVLAALSPTPTGRLAQLRADWSSAFEQQEREFHRVPLAATSSVPTDLRGTLFKNGPARFRRGGDSYAHWLGTVATWNSRPRRA